MKTKKLLKFYFNADEAVSELDRLIYRRAVVPDFYRPAEECAERVIELVEKRKQLCALASYLDGIMDSFSLKEIDMLKSYALPREQTGMEDGKEAHRLTVKFTRLALLGIAPYREALQIVNGFVIG